MRARIPKVLAVAALCVGFLAGPAQAASAMAGVQAPCPPGTEWDPILKKCIPYDPDDAALR